LTPKSDSEVVEVDGIVETLKLTDFFVNSKPYVCSEITYELSDLKGEKIVNDILEIFNNY